ncbi:hypothetical protein HKX48_003932 [Thoreauomyces humboldtii]|nr:hypothetical protein HKX48_003932 [Thoreauomyces humboldtii]
MPPTEDGSERDEPAPPPFESTQDHEPVQKAQEKDKDLPTFDPTWTHPDGKDHFGRTEKDATSYQSSTTDVGAGSASSSSPGPRRGFLSKLFGPKKPDAVKAAAKEKEIEAEEFTRWGPPGSPLNDMVMRYIEAIGVTKHRLDLIENKPKQYLRLLRMGYFEPIPVAWAQDRRGPLNRPPLEMGGFDDAGEERLYWALNVAGAARGASFLRVDDASMMAQQSFRVMAAHAVDMSWGSPIDFCQQGKTKKSSYSKQVPPAPVSRAVEEVRHLQTLGQVDVDTMILMDCSGSMGREHLGVDQPKHIDVVHNVLFRAIHHMETRDAFPDQSGVRGVETVLFNSSAIGIGKVNHENFVDQWPRIRRMVGGGTCVMQGWLEVKRRHFDLHGGPGKSWVDPKFGQIAEPGFTKLSLLVLLDGEAIDMDEFELELLGQSWAYVTILLIGRESCPRHFRHAVELERVARGNDHVQFVDCQGRIAERLMVHDVLKRVYAETAPDRDEIMDPAFEHEPPTYTFLA